MNSIAKWTLGVVAMLGAAVPFNAVAQHRDRGWHGDIRHFDHHDTHRWRSGVWRHGVYGGRVGWWWMSYPYPDPYQPPVIVVERAPQPVVVPIQPAPQAPATFSPPVAQFWYYCESAGAYYPYVATCPSGWKTVPATPPGVTP